jgi:hypothetical protein
MAIMPLPLTLQDRRGILRIQTRNWDYLVDADQQECNPRNTGKKRAQEGQSPFMSFQVHLTSHCGKVSCTQSAGKSNLGPNHRWVSMILVYDCRKTQRHPSGLFDRGWLAIERIDARSWANTISIALSVLNSNVLLTPSLSSSKRELRRWSGARKRTKTPTTFLSR